MRWYYFLFAVAVVVLFLGVALSQFFWPLFAIGPVFWMVMGNSVRCPRCRKGKAMSHRGCLRPRPALGAGVERTMSGLSSGYCVQNLTEMSAKGR